MNRRSLFKMLGGAAAAYACPLPVTAAPVAAVTLAGSTPTSALTMAMLDRIHKQLTVASGDAWRQRHREAYAEIAAGKVCA